MNVTNNTGYRNWMLKVSALARKFNLSESDVISMIENLDELNELKLSLASLNSPSPLAKDYINLFKQENKPIVNSDRSKLDVMIDAANMLFESCEFDGVTIDWSGTWDCSDKTDFIKIVGFTEHYADPENQLGTGSVHVNFDTNGDWVSIYMLDVMTGNMFNTNLPKELSDLIMDDSVINLIKDTLSNDISSTDEDLVLHFMNTHLLSKRQAEAWVSVRNSFLIDPIKEGDTPSQVFATLKVTNIQERV